MKPFFILIISLSFSLIALGQADSLGFTNKAEAKNLMVNGLKEGKWVEYWDKLDTIVPDTNWANRYRLIIYKAGKPLGIVRFYYRKSGKLLETIPYSNGKKNGMEREYYEDGKLSAECPYVNGKIKGVSKTYYESGKLESEFPYTDNRSFVVREYYENGNLKSEKPYTNGKCNGIMRTYYESGKIKCEWPYTDGKAGDCRCYYENGNEIK